MGLRKNGKYTADIMHRYSATQDFSATQYLNLTDANVTESGDLWLKRDRDHGEFDGRTETMIIVAKGFWSQATVTIQDVEEETA